MRVEHRQAALSEYGEEGRDMIDRAPAVLAAGGGVFLDRLPVGFSLGADVSGIANS
jgi:hypothetical protein